MVSPFLYNFSTLLAMSDSSSGIGKSDRIDSLLKFHLSIGKMPLMLILKAKIPKAKLIKVTFSDEKVYRIGAKGLIPLRHENKKATH